MVRRKIKENAAAAKAELQRKCTVEGLVLPKQEAISFDLLTELRKVHFWGIYPGLYSLYRRAKDIAVSGVVVPSDVQLGGGHSGCRNLRFDHALQKNPIGPRLHYRHLIQCCGKSHCFLCRFQLGSGKDMCQYLGYCHPWCKWYGEFMAQVYQK